jgi:hypothetical protein
MEQQKAAFLRFLCGRFPGSLGFMLKRILYHIKRKKEEQHERSSFFYLLNLQCKCNSKKE